MKELKNVQQLTLGAILVGINLIFVILNVYLPFFSLFILIGIPFISSLMKVKCDFKYTILYFITCLLLGFIIDYQTCLFYLLPSLISGILFGFLIEKKVHGFFIIIFSSLANIIIQFSSIVMLNLIYSIDFIEAFTSLLGINQDTFFNSSLVFFFCLSLIQMFFSYIIIASEIKKFSLSIKEDYNLFLIIFIINFILSLFSLIFFFIPIISNLLTGLSLVFSIYLFDYIIRYKNKYLKITSFIILGTVYLLSFIFSSLFKEHGFNLYFNLFSLTISIISVILIIDSLINKNKINVESFRKEY